MRKYHLLFTILAFVLSVAGCATVQEPPQPPIDTSKLVWPPPPDEAKVKFVTLYRGGSDLEGGQSFLRFLGEDVEGNFRRPHGIVADRKGNIFVSDTELLIVYKLDFEKKRSTTIGESGTQQVRIPMGLAIDNDRGYLFIADLFSKTVMVYDKDTGSFKFAIGQAADTFKRPVSIALNTKTQMVYVADTKLHMVKVFDYSGKFLFSIGKGERSLEDDGFNVPSSVAISPKDGKLYVSDMFNRYIKVFTSDGKFVKKIGQGVGTGFGFFSKLIGVALDSEGHLYGLDVDFGNFQIFDEESNQLLTYVSKSGKNPGDLLLPTTIFIDEKDRIYVTDTFNFRVQVFQYLGSRK